MNTQHTRDVTALAESATDRIRDELESLDHVSDDARKAAIRRVLRERTVGLDEHELSAFLSGVRDGFPDRAYDVDQKRNRMAAELDETKRALSRALAETERLRHADSTRAGAARAVATAVASGAGEDVRDGTAVADFETVASIVSALTRFAVRQEDVARATLKVVPGAVNTDTRGPQLGQLIVAALRGEAGAEDAFNRRLGWIGRTPGAIVAATQQSWKTGTQRLLEHLSPSGGLGVMATLKATQVVRKLKEQIDEIFNDFDRHVDSFFRQPFNNMLRSRLGERQRPDE